MYVSIRTMASKAALLDAMETALRDAFVTLRETPFAVLISGGNTPLPVYASIAANPPVAAPNAGIAFADDRYVPETSPESNYGNARAMIQALRMTDSQVIRIHPDLPLETAADRYHEDLDAFFARGGSIPIAFLGLGADGHTCSLFTEADLARCAGRWAAPVYKETPPDRITVGPALLARVERVVFIVAGNDKIEMIKALTDAPDTIVAGKAIAGCPVVELWQA